MGENLSDPGYGDKLLDATHTKGMKRKGKIIRLDCTKIKNFCYVSTHFTI